MTKFKERLWPTPWLYIILLMLVPAILLVLLPVNRNLGFVLAPTAYILFAGFFTLSSPRIELTEDTLRAGHASIETKYLGQVKILDKGKLRDALSVKADARAFLMIRGWIKYGVIIENTDVNDPAPYWLITSRYPERFKEALESLSK